MEKCLQGYCSGGRKKMMSPTLLLCFFPLQGFPNASTLSLSPPLRLRCSQVFSPSLPPLFIYYFLITSISVAYLHFSQTMEPLNFNRRCLTYLSISVDEYLQYKCSPVFELNCKHIILEQIYYTFMLVQCIC